MLVDELQSSRTVFFMVLKLQVTNPHQDFILHEADLELTASGVLLRAQSLAWVSFFTVLFSAHFARTSLKQMS